MRKLNVAVGLSVLASTLAGAPNPAHAAGTVRILAGGRTTATVKLPNGEIRFSANSIKVNSIKVNSMGAGRNRHGKRGPIKLSGNVAIDVLNGKTVLMRITANEAVVEADAADRSG